MKDIIIKTETQKEFDQLLVLLERYGFLWMTGDVPTMYSRYFKNYIDKTFVVLSFTENIKKRSHIPTNSYKSIYYGHADHFGADAISKSKYGRIITLKEYIEYTNPEEPKNFNLELIKTLSDY